MVTDRYQPRALAAWPGLPGPWRLELRLLRAPLTHSAEQAWTSPAAVFALRTGTQQPFALVPPCLTPAEAPTDHTLWRVPSCTQERRSFPRLASPALP